MAVTVPLNFLVWLRGCFILYVANCVWPCNLEGLLDLPWRYFYSSEAFMMCEAYTSHVSHPSQCVIVINWGIPWMSQVWTLVQLRRFWPLLVVAHSFHLYLFLDSFFTATELLVGFFRVHLGVLWWWFVKSPDDYYLITLCLLKPWLSPTISIFVSVFLIWTLLLYAWTNLTYLLLCP